MNAVATCPVRAILPLDVLDRGGIPHRINVRVEGGIPVVGEEPPIVARVRLAGTAIMAGGGWPRGPERQVEYAGLHGRTYISVSLPYELEPGGQYPAQGLTLMGREADITGVLAFGGPYHAATGRRDWTTTGESSVSWERSLADRYDLTWAEPVVASFRKGAAENLLFAGGRLYKFTPLPRWWANASGNEIVLEDRPKNTYSRNADVFDLDRLADARRYMTLVPRVRREPVRVGGAIEDVSQPYLACGRDDLCARIAPWIANRFARYLADLPGDLVRHAHDAANYTTGGLIDRERLLPALCELLERSSALPPTRRGEFPEEAVRDLLIRLHRIEGVPRYREQPQVPGCDSKAFEPGGSSSAQQRGPA